MPVSGLPSRLRAARLDHLRGVAEEGAPDPAGGGAPGVEPRPDVTCVVTPEHPEVVPDALARFWQVMEDAPTASLRVPFEVAVSELATAIAHHARPQLVRLRVRLVDDRLVASLADPGGSWVGPPAPERLLDALAESHGSFASARTLLDESSYRRQDSINRWRLAKVIGTRPAKERRSRRRERTLRQRTNTLILAGVIFQSALIGLLALAAVLAVRWHATAWAVALALVCAAGDACLIVAPLLLILRPRLLGQLDALQRLADVAARTADMGQVPDTERVDEVGELARTLQRLRQAWVEWEILMEQAPVGIARVSLDGRCLSVGRVLAEYFHGSSREEMTGRLFTETLHPGDRAMLRTKYLSMLEGRQDSYVLQTRHRDRAGTSTVTISPVRGADGRPESFITIVQDTTELSQQQARATMIQRALLPNYAPRIDGYQLAGACLSAQDVAGDFYDWQLSDDGHLDLTVADVMGKGMGAALLMAAVRTGLRAAPDDIGPSRRVKCAADAIALGTVEEGLFATLFHARLDLASGGLSYVDAGHGHCAIRRASGELVHLSSDATPLFVLPEETFDEQLAQILPGDTLIVYSDGLVELKDRLVPLSEYSEDLDGAEDADDLVKRLVGRMPAFLPDDVTIVVLRRLIDTAAAGAPIRPSAALRRQPSGQQRPAGDRTRHADDRPEGH